MKSSERWFFVKKVLIAADIKSLTDKEESFLKRADIRIFTSTSNEEVFHIHKTEKVDLIIARLDDPEMGGDVLCSLIRDDPELLRVSIIMVCSPKRPAVQEKTWCKANVLITEPIIMPVLFEKAHCLLSIAQREFFRSPIIVKVRGEQKNEAFFCLSENISASGMLFGTDKILRRGDSILCSFVLPNSTRILSEAEIVRVVERTVGDIDTNQYGMRFLDLDVESKSAIELFVQETMGDRQ
jgi:DNA-binding response OmpR family regulator